MEVVPTILEEDIKSVFRKLSLVEGVSTRVQIDIMDGRFVPKKTFFTPEDFATIPVSCELELHLMIENPALFIPRWSRVKNVKRIYFHIEASKNIGHDISLIRSQGLEVGLAIDPNGHPKKIYPYLSQIDDILFLGVRPGFSGQIFLQNVLLNIRTLRNIAPFVSISVDGGVDESTAPLIKQAGANRLVSSSYLFSSNNISRAKHILEAICS